MLSTVMLLLVLAVSVANCSSMMNIDLGYELNENSMRWLNSGSFTRRAVFKGYTSTGAGWYESNYICTPEHVSTHLDAPLHFGFGKWSVSEIPLEHLISQGVVVDIRHKVKENPTAELTAEDLIAWMDNHGPLPDGAIVFVLTGWGSRYGNQTTYFGTPTNDTTKLIFPGIHLSAAQLLRMYEQVSGRRIFGVGIDTASLDYGPSTTFKTHAKLFEANIYGLENVANLEKLPTKGFEVTVMPMKMTGGSGSPTRIIARIPQQQEPNAAITSSQPLYQHFRILLTIAIFLRLF